MCDLCTIMAEDKTMCVITATEFKRNFGKYVLLGQKEKIEVTHRGKTIFTIIPEKEKLLADWDRLFGTLPMEALTDDDIERE